MTAAGEIVTDINPLYYKILHSFGDNSSHNISQALAIASESAISLWHWSNIYKWHADCGNTTFDFMFAKIC